MAKVVILDRYEYTTKDDKVIHSYTVYHGVKPVGKNDKLVDTFEYEVRV